MQAHAGDRLVGAIVSKAEPTKAGRLRGYIAMLVVDPDFRKGGIGMRLAAHTISKMRETCDEVRSCLLCYPPWRQGDCRQCI